MKPGLGAIYSASSAALAATLAEVFGGPAGIALVAVLAAISFDLLNLCSQGDPGDVVLTPTDILTAYHGELGQPSLDALTKVQRWFTHLMFPVWCNCSDGTVPPPAVASPPPSESPNPNMAPGTTGANCWDAQSTIVSNTNSQWKFNELLPDLGDLAGWPSNGGPPPRKLPLPLPTSMRFITTRNTQGQPSESYSATVQFRDTAGAVISSGSIFGTTTPAGVMTTLTGPVPTNAVYLDLATNSINPATGTYTAFGEVTLYCGTQTPTTPIVPCCPPDPGLDARLTYLTGLVQFLVGNQSAPIDALLDGHVHANLSGSASVLLTSECAAVRVTVHSPLPPLAVNPGTPPYYFSMGFITSYAAGSPLKGWRLVYVNQTFPLATFADQVGYTLPAGVTIDITELLGATAP